MERINRIWNHPEYQKHFKSITGYEADRVFIDQHKGHAVIVPIHQINTRVINLHIAPKHSRYDIERLPRSVQVWYERLQQEGMTGKNKENFLSVFTYLDSVLEHDLR